MAFVVDSFTDSAVALQSHSGETGAAWTKHTSYSAAPDAEISNANRAKNTGAGTDVLYYASGTPGSADYSVAGTVVIKSTSASRRVGLVGRIDTAADTHYRFRYDNQSQWILEKKVAGTVTTLGTPWSEVIADEDSRAATLEMVGTAIKGFVAGVERVSATDSSITAAGKAGILFQGAATNTSGIHLENIDATDLGAGGGGGGGAVGYGVGGAQINKYAINHPGTVAAGGTTTTYETGLQSAIQPFGRENHHVIYSFAKSASAGETVNLSVSLVEGTAVRATWAEANIASTETQRDRLLTQAEMDSLGGYSDLRLRFSFTHLGDSTARKGRVYWARMVVPVSTAGVFFLTPSNLNHQHRPSQASLAEGGPVKADQVTVGGIEVSVMESPALTIDDRIEERSVASFAVLDVDGTQTFARGERVMINDHERRRAFAGYVWEVSEHRINRSGARRHMIRCVDNHYKADKRRVAKSYSEQTTTAIVEDLVRTYLEPEDVYLSNALIDP